MSNRVREDRRATRAGGAATGDSPFVELFDSETPDARRLGGKGASLCRLVQNGYRVPPGLVVTVDAFQRTCEALDLATAVAAVDAALAGTGEMARAGDEITERLQAGRIPAEVLDPTLRAVADLGLWNRNVAGLIVRSSATVEDSAFHSFAGIFESIPISAAEELEPTIRGVWASVFSPRALAYYREVGLEGVPTMAVVVQRFISAVRSGVMFTTFGGRTLVEHVEGDCEKLVKGEVTPEQLWLSGPRREAETSGSLDPVHVRELARLAGTLEERFGGPQDVEWVLYDEHIHVVQSRPITTGIQPTDHAAATPAGLENATAVLTGTGASGGWGAGEVHLAFNIEDALALTSGKILVTPMTNPDMVVAMRKSAAIVTDVGGMICHAAIVSRELGLPCVVGTAKATTTLRTGEVVTVSGSAGAVYRGALDIASRAARKRPATWSDVWSSWATAPGSRPDRVPIVPTIEALESMAGGRATVVIVPDVDLRMGPDGLWVDLERLSDADADVLLDEYLTRLETVAHRQRLERLYILPRDSALARRISDRLKLRGPSTLRMHSGDPDAPAIKRESDDTRHPGPLAVPLAALGSQPVTSMASAVGGMQEAREAALDTIKFFGHEPASHTSAMPRAKWRGGWWAILPEYGRFHQEHATASQTGEFTWLNVRPELVISPMLKSLVQPGFEMVPRVMGFRDLPPMHLKWQSCRYHFRSDTFALVWRAIVSATWDEAYMADLMRRVRMSYDYLEDVLVLFPKSDAERAALSPKRIEALITSWWPRWVEFFALCWFIQAQGDDVLYPFIEETVKDNLRRAPEMAGDAEWASPPDLIAPLSPVLSGAYMADLTDLRQALLASGLRAKDQALAALERGESPEIARRVSEHLTKWHWMRDRDLYFEPWDTPDRVVETALRTDPHAPAPYEANRRRHAIALGVHFDLAQATGRADGLHHATRFLHDLNVERENHHVLWLKFSYPLRGLIVEVERRLVALGSLRPGDIFFLQAPELLAATRALPAPLPPDLVSRVRNRRRAFLHEARLELSDPATLTREDDYY